MSYKEPIQRYKGLGEMDADQLAETTMDPRHRMLRRIRIEDAEAAERAFSLLMGSEVAPRKEFIIAGAHQLDAESLICRASICSVRYLAGHCGALRGSGGWRVTIHEFLCENSHAILGDSA